LTYDDKGRVTNADLDSEFGLDATFVWSDDAVMVNSDWKNYTLNLNNGLAQSTTDGDTFTYNSSNRLTTWSHNTILWDGDKHVSINKEIFTYGTSCKKGYFPLFAYFIDDVDRTMLLLTANPEIAGIKTNQQPTSIYGNPVEYKFDKEGYISEIEIKATGGSLVYTLTWK
jgi:hypothetical protein